MAKSRQASRNTLWLIMFWSLLICGFLSVAGRCWYLQRYKSEEFQARAARQQLKIIPQTPRRGMIVDRIGRILAISVKVPSVWADPKLIEDKDGVAQAVGAILQMDGDELAKEMHERGERRFMWIRRFVSDQQGQMIKDLHVRGLGVRYEFQRQYPMGQLASHVIGFTDIDGKGLEGLERKFDDTLSGESGVMKFRSDVLKRPVGAQGENKELVDGSSITLSIDAVIQATVEEGLEAVVKKFQAESATGIVMDPKTGEVLAMANWPTFNLDNARNARPEVRRNRALTDPYEPGSTFKPVTVASALEGGFVTINQKIDCLQHDYVGKGFGRIGEYKHPYGVLSVAGILVHSSNVGSAKLAQKMGKPYFYRMIEKFGFGKKTGIDLPGEGVGILRPLEAWNDKDYTLTRVAYGQGIAVTPIQLIRAFCTFANGGKLVRPRMVRGVFGPDGELVEDFIRSDMEVSLVSTDTAGRVISENVTKQLVEKGLAGVVANEGGSAHKAALEGWTVFGKTGTAQVAKKDGRGYEPNKWVSSFIAGAPMSDPQVCVLVLVRDPDRSLGYGYTGGMVAASTVGDILQKSLSYLGVPKENAGENAVASR